MNHSSDNSSEGFEPEATPAFKTAMKELGRSKVLIPAEVDAGVVRKARDCLREGARNRTKVVALPWPQWTAIAAAAVVGLFVIWMIRQPASDTGFQISKEDLDRNGRVDILDAFWLARRLQADDTETLEWDLNADGRVDQGDIDFLAQRAVTLEAKS